MITVVTATQRVEIPDITHAAARALVAGAAVAFAGCTKVAHHYAVKFKFNCDAQGKWTHIADEMDNG